MTAYGVGFCWHWQGALSSNGYGQFQVRRGKERVHYATHRLAWELTYGPIPDGLFVCHRCDEPSCCNPLHLWLGTCAENLADMRAKGRHPYMGVRKVA